ncbi:TspO/MBR family protein [Oesophagostomum dentatum]|uniref:TspO/MBR family protein n=1 Tax=Oesophagostomum dentatum TaxID=61180 RepID=A0A0B1ST97_OESDE|nr:TspO/MBR family protein [Oesophagostomum dentatum]
MVPAGAAVAAFAVFARDQEVVNWWTSIKKPNWAPTDVRLYSVMDILALAPLGYASYLVYKNGGGFDYTDTRLALGLYGANMALALATIPMVKKKSLSCVSSFSVFKIDRAILIY